MQKLDASKIKSRTATTDYPITAIRLLKNIKERILVGVEETKSGKYLKNIVAIRSAVVGSRLRNIRGDI